ncbi:uroporphyrinogen-III synthase [Pelagibacterium montanilacus]|uniref:uroporphyrinogen-III synthase n=1 Tax=Pelagibacterium montanilacus TaxID=2185280 RepID=UPI000F8E0820|nr:uroporphyrinogen-III synthase [Pelagibacterium montanilacus]
MARRPALLVTRPQPDADRLADHLDALGIEPVLAPMLEARAIPHATMPLDRTLGAIAITSANAVRFLVASGQHQDFVDLPVFTVGDASAHECRQAGFSKVTSARGTLADLAELMGRAAPPGTILYPAAHHRSGDLAGLMAPHDRVVETRVLYEMVATTQMPQDVAERLHEGTIAGALFYSRRTAEVFSGLCADPEFAATRADLEALCISETCAEPLVARHFTRISLADAPDAEAMLVLALAFAREQIEA